MNNDYNQNGNQQGFSEQQQGQQSFYQPPQGNFYRQPPYIDQYASSSQTFGIIALVGLFFCQILSIIFGAIAMSRAKKSEQALGYECSEAKTGRICGLIGLIFGIIAVVITVLYLIFFFAVIFNAIVNGMEY